MRTIAGILISVGLTISGCAEKEVILPGERLPVRNDSGIGVIAAASETVTDAVAVPALSLAAPRRLDDWPMRVGNVLNDPPHATLSAAPQLVWSANIGAGDSRRQRITADPVSDGSRIYTLDARSGVTATALNGGTIWSRNLVPGSERASDASGGGVAVAAGTVFVSTGFGDLHALDAATGRERWVQRLDAPITTPKVAGGLVYVVSRDNRAWAINADTGRIQWDLSAAPSTSVMATAPAPAITDRAVLFPFGSGEVVAALRQSGVRVWGSPVSGRRRGVAYNGVGDITGDPVVSVGPAVLSQPAAQAPSGHLCALWPGSGWRTPLGGVIRRCAAWLRPDIWSVDGDRRPAGWRGLTSDRLWRRALCCQPQGFPARLPLSGRAAKPLWSLATRCARRRL